MDNLIHQYSEEGNIAGIQQELDNGVDVNIQDRQGYTPLHYASKSGNREAILFLINNRAVVNSRNNMNQTPLLLACCRSRDVESVRILLDNGAEIDVCDIWGERPIMTNKDCNDLLSSYSSLDIKEPDL